MERHDTMFCEKFFYTFIQRRKNAAPSVGQPYYHRFQPTLPDSAQSQRQAGTSVHSTGSGSYVVDDEYYDVKAGNIIICNAGVLHDEVPQYNRELSMLSIAIDNLQLEGLPENHLISADIKPVLKVEKHFVLMDAIFQTIFDSVAFDSEEQQETNQYLTQALLSLLIHAFKQYGQPNTEHSKEDPLLKDIKQYIDENYSEDLTLQKISDQFLSARPICHTCSSGNWATPRSIIS